MVYNWVYRKNLEIQRFERSFHSWPVASDQLESHAVNWGWWLQHWLYNLTPILGLILQEDTWPTLDTLVNHCHCQCLVLCAQHICLVGESNTFASKHPTNQTHTRYIQRIKYADIYIYTAIDHSIHITHKHVGVCYSFTIAHICSVGLCKHSQLHCPS